MAYISNSNDDTIIVGTSGNDTIENSGNRVTIIGGAGNDLIYSTGINALIYSEIGDDKVRVRGGYSTVHAGTGDDTISVEAACVQVFGGSDNDSIIVDYGSDAVTVDGGKGRDYIEVRKIGNYSSLLGGADKDTLNVNVEESDKLYATLIGGRGDDSISAVGYSSFYSWHIVSNYSSGDGNDYVYLSVETATVQIATNEFSSVKSPLVYKNIYTADGGKVTVDGYHVDTVDVVNYDNGLSANGQVLNVNYNYNGDLFMCAPANYVNENIVTINAAYNSNDMRIFGNWNSNYIISGDGQTTLFGGNGVGGNDTLIGGESRNYFIYNGGGNDVAINFKTGMATDSDVVAFWDMNFAGFSRSGGKVYVKTSEGASIELQTISQPYEVIQYTRDGTNVYGAIVAEDGATDVLFFNGANYFQLSQWGNLVVSDASNNNIWLDGSDGRSYAYVANIDASASSGYNVLAGNSGNNVITAGSGGSMLWGGSGSSADTLIGGTNGDTFFFGKGDGADVISNASAGDTAFLYDISINDITSINTAGNTITLGFNTGANLQIQSSENLSAKITMAEGSVRFNNATNAWQFA